MDGSLEISDFKANSDSINITQTENGWTVKSDFTNNYKISEVSYTICGQKILMGREMQEGEFTFILIKATDSSGNADDNAEKQATKNNADGTFCFEPITFSEEGNYYYVVSETHSGEDNHIFVCQKDSESYYESIKAPYKAF